jgi:uncharacterized membrane protein YkvA (DUF1232 family)
MAGHRLVWEGKMRSLFTAAVVTILVLVAAWAILYVLAKRLPPGFLRDVVGFLPDCTQLLWRLRRHPDVPTSAKVAVVFAVLWVISPIDLIPEFIPVIGPLDDAVVVALTLRFAARRVPRDVIEQAWTGDPRALRLLVGATPAGVV